MSCGPLTRLLAGLIEEPARFAQEQCVGLSADGQALVREWAEAAIAAGQWELPAGVSLDEFVRELTVVPTGSSFVCPGEDVEVITHTGRVIFGHD